MAKSSWHQLQNFLNSVEPATDPEKTFVKTIKDDVKILEKYLLRYEEYRFLKELEDLLLPTPFRDSEQKCFVEDKTKDEVAKYRARALNGSSKLFANLIFGKIYDSDKTIKWSNVYNIPRDNEDKTYTTYFLKNYDDFERIFENTEKELLEQLFENIEKLKVEKDNRDYLDFVKNISLNNKMNKLAKELLRFKVYLEKEFEADIEELFDKYLNNSLKDYIGWLISERELFSAYLYFAYKIRIPLTRNPSEITKSKGRKYANGKSKHLLEMSSSYTLEELEERIKEKRKILEALLQPYLASQFVCYALYEHYFNEVNFLKL